MTRNRNLAVLATLAAACGGPRHGNPPNGGPGEPVFGNVAPDFSATRWIPEHPTYVLAARHAADAQRALADVVDSVGLFGINARTVIGVATQLMLGADLLSPQALLRLGIDPDGGIAIFSEALAPTIVVHVGDATVAHDAFANLQPTSVTRIANVDVASKQFPGATLSWAIDRDWLWLHVTPIGFADTPWFESSHRAKPQPWADDWRNARSTVAEPTWVGFVDPHSLIGRLPQAIACVQLVKPVGRVGFAIDGSPQGAGIHVAIDVGPAAQTIEHAILPPPDGWQATAQTAPLAVQWNLDLDVAYAWLDPCLRSLDVELPDPHGVRAARVVLATLDPANKDGTGAAILDIKDKKLFARYLDKIPMRSTLESDRTFGPYKGHSLGIPFGPRIDYVLTDHVALFGLGDGVLARVVGNGPAAHGPIVAIDVAPAALSREAWQFLLREAHLPGAERIAAHLQDWRAAHFAVRVEGTRLIVDATGSRR